MKLSVELLRTIGYSDPTIIRRIIAAADAAEAEQIRTIRAVEGTATRLTPIQACAGSTEKARIFEETRGMIRDMSARNGTPLDLVPNEPVSVYALDKALKGADPQSRIACKSALAQLGLIP